MQGTPPRDGATARGEPASRSHEPTHCDGLNAVALEALVEYAASFVATKNPGRVFTTCPTRQASSAKRRDMGGQLRVALSPLHPLTQCWVNRLECGIAADGGKKRRESRESSSTSEQDANGDDDDDASHTVVPS